MGIVIGDKEFDPTLRSRIAAFIDAFFEEPSFDDELAVQRCSTGTFGRLLGSLDRRKGSAAIDADVDEQVCYEAAALCGSAGDLKTWLDQVDEPFSTTLLALIDRKGLSDVDVYKRAHMSRQLFSRIRSDASYRPAKKTVLALAIAMSLSLDEMRDLLARAGFALSRSSKRDLIVEYFVSNGVYDLFAINEALYEFDQPLI